MFNKFIKIVICFSLVLTSLNAQEVDYDGVYFKQFISATMPELQSYKTFDLTFSNEMESLFKKDKEGNLNFKPSFGAHRQVENSEELHVFSTLYSIKLGADANKNPTYDVDLHTFIFNKYGTKLYEKRYNYSGVPYRANADNNKYGLKYYCVEQAIANSLADYVYSIEGYTANLSTKVAKLDDVKKNTELYAFVDQAKELKKEFNKSPADFVKAAEKYVPFWEKMTAYSEGKNADEVKRAAYQNLAVYYILSKNAEKALEVIEPYKKIDKEIKEMFGLVKYKNSEECEKLLGQLVVKTVKIDEKAGGDVVLSKAVIADRMNYKTIDGTVTIKDKRIGGTYTGQIKIRNMATTGGSSGGMLNLDAADIEMLIIAKNAKGNMDTLRSVISRIEDMKDNAGKKYIAQKFSNVLAFAAAGNAGNYGLLVVSFESPKVNVYRCIVPTSYSQDYVVRKTGDEKGIRSGGLTDFKKLTDYLSDCAEIATQVKAGQVDRKITPEKLAEQYSNCK
jgi:hypothetical protein